MDLGFELVHLLLFVLVGVIVFKLYQRGRDNDQEE